jgi:pimeloyl-ACP methyl ester carboxylesterase
LILALPGIAGGPIHLVGHSFGASVALKTALLLDRQVKKLQGRMGRISKRARCATTSNVSDRSAIGRRWRSASRTIGWAPPNFYEWDAVIADTLEPDTWRRSRGRSWSIRWSGGS